MATRAPASDSAAGSAMPVVPRPRAGPSAALLGIGAIVAGILLFLFLDARRRSLSIPAVAARASDTIGKPAPPPLYIPPEPPLAIVPGPLPAPVVVPPVQPAQALRPQVIYVPQPTVPAPAMPPAMAQPAASGPTLIIDTSGPAGAASAAATATATAAGSGPAQPGATQTARVRAGMLANRATTVPQGTLMPAVLETAFDSTRPGLARAVVSRDVRGFDGSRILIPRGSRLVGEYGSDVSAGQKRALVNWTRLVRPDGATIAIGSPAADPLGRGGVRARVNSHFLERFGGAILRSALDIGTNLASRAGDNPVIIALPGTLQNNVGQGTRTSDVVPTLTVKQGTSISIFVARDLDFTGVESR